VCSHGNIIAVISLLTSVRSPCNVLLTSRILLIVLHVLSGLQLVEDDIWYSLAL